MRVKSIAAVEYESKSPSEIATISRNSRFNAKMVITLAPEPRLILPSDRLNRDLSCAESPPTGEVTVLLSHEVFELEPFPGVCIVNNFGNKM
jgi:hypothetical protein